MTNNMQHIIANSHNKRLRNFF